MAWTLIPAGAMHTELHFISGLPRSGSTLLSAILRQNPKLHADITSPLARLVSVAMHEMSGAHETSVFFNAERRAAVLRGIISGYYRDAADKTILDTNRAWTGKLAVLDEILPKARVVCCVRNPAWIFDSFERIIHTQPLAPSRIFNHETGGNIYDRFEALNRGSGIVGSAWNALRQAFYGAFSQKLLLVRYETLVRDPAHCIEKIYAHLGLAPFQHDFDNVIFQSEQFDEFLSTPGLHTVRKTVSYTERQTIVPPDLFNRLSNDAFWNDPANNTRNVVVI